MSKVKMEMPIVITYTASATINMGNYESRKVSVGLSLPVEDKKQIATKYKKVRELTNKLLMLEVERIQKERDMGKDVFEEEDL